MKKQKTMSAFVKINVVANNNQKKKNKKKFKELKEAGQSVKCLIVWTHAARFKVESTRFQEDRICSLVVGSFGWFCCVLRGSRGRSHEVNVCVRQVKEN